MPNERFKAPTGTHDVLPPESDRWQALVARFAGLARRSGYGLLQSPVFEDASVFSRVGEATDVVRKEMYDFDDKGGRRLALRPEGTASVVRAFVQHHPTTPWKVWYAAPSFRYERPQAGRYRQHHQLGVEAIGTDDPDLDVEVITMAWDLFQSLGLRRIILLLNSLGDPVCRPPYVELLREYLHERSDQLCSEHRERIDVNPLRVLDCKRQVCIDATRDAPRMVDHLCGPCQTAFQRVQIGLGSMGVPYAIETRLVRGLDYYTRTTFEFQASALESAQNAIGGGGRYDGLVEMLGGDAQAGIGFGLGIERMLLACDAEDVFPAPATTLDVFVVDITGGDAARDLTASFRRAGIAADRAFGGRSMRAQMKLADRSNAPIAVIIGDDEAAAATATVREMQEGGGQETVSADKVVDHVKGLLP